MELEVVNFYPKTKNDNKNFLGTIHIYVKDIDIHIRGIKVFKTKKGYFFKLPFSKGVDEKTKKVVHYPLLSFTQKEKNKELFLELLKHGREKVLEWESTHIENTKLNEVNRARKTSKFISRDSGMAGVSKDKDRSFGRPNYHGRKPFLDPLRPMERKVWS